MHDALESHRPRFSAVHRFRHRQVPAHPLAAAAQAARDVINHVSPTRQAENDAELAFSLGEIPDGRGKTRGITLGIASAAAIINARANDKMLLSRGFRAAGPARAGDYRPVPPLEFVHRPAFGDSSPFRNRLGR